MDKDCISRQLLPIENAEYEGGIVASGVRVGSVVEPVTVGSRNEWSSRSDDGLSTMILNRLVSTNLVGIVS